MVAERKITRNRISYSCQTCRRRKVKCDKIHPVCSGCQKAGEECIWGDGDHPNSQDQPGILDTNDSPSKKRKELSEAGDLPETDFKDSNGLQAVEQKLAQLTSLMHDLSRYTPPTSQNASPSNLHALHEQSQHENAPDPKSSTPWSNILSRLDDLNSFLQSVNVKRLPGSSDTNSRNPQSQDDVPNEDSNYQRAKRTPLHGLSRSQILRFMSDTSDPDFLAPHEDESNALLRSWLSSVYPIYPIVSPHLILAKYREFRKWYNHDLDRGIPNPVRDFMPLINTAFYGGIVAMSAKGIRRWIPWTTRSAIIAGLHTKFSESLEKANYSCEPSVFPLAAAIIIQSMTFQSQNGVGNSMDITAALRAAQISGIHRERNLAELGAVEAEMRRRIWWELVHLDISASTASALPPLVNEGFSDVMMTSELKDSVIRDSEYGNHLPQSGELHGGVDDPSNFENDSIISVVQLVAKARYLLAAASQKLLKINMGAKQMTKEDMKEVRRILYGVAEQVRGVIDKIPARGIPELDFVPQSTASSDIDHLPAMGDPITDEEIEFYVGKREPHSDMHKSRFPFAQKHRAAKMAFHKWARISLSLMVDRLNSVSYAPFLKNAKSKVWMVARNCALKDCHSFMRKFLSLASDPELERFRWAWPTLFQPMHAVIIMLIDVYERPHSLEASRSRAFIDKMFSLAAPENGIVGGDYGVTSAIPLKEGGDEVWNMVWKLRRKAWQKAKLDPDVLWTEEDQIQVGVGVPLNENELFRRSLREDILHLHKVRIAQRYGQEVAPRPDDLPKLALDRYTLATIRDELLHPTQAGIPGDTMTGPLRDIVVQDSEADNLTSLVVKARDDQEKMPFSLSGSANRSVTEKAGKRFSEFLELKEKEQDGSQIFHVGQLIKKIKNMQTEIQAQKGGRESPERSGNDKSANGNSTINTKESQTFLTPNSLAQDGGADSVDMRDQPATSRQDIVNRSSVFSHPVGLSEIDTSDFTMDFTAPISQGSHLFYPKNKKPYAPDPWLEQSGKLRDVSHLASKENQSATHLQPSTVGNSDSMNLELGQEFDWQRWDEVFGQEFSGFEDLLGAGMDWDHAGQP